MARKKKTDKRKELLILCLLIAIVIVISLICIWLVPEDEKWIQSGNTITKGEESYEIGDYYDYDETKDGKIEELTDVKWKVMGVDEKGNLLIMSASSVEDITLGTKDDIEKTQIDYLEGVDRLNEIAEKYGHAENALGARSITSEDINKLTGYNTKYSDSYNVSTTYYWADTKNPKAQTEGKEMYDIVIEHNNRFIWFDEASNKWMTSIKEETNNYDNPEKIVTLKHTQIMYDNAIYDHTIDDEPALVEPESLKYNMIFKNDNGEYEAYWTATRTTVATEKYAAFGYNVVRRDGLNYSSLLYSSGNIYEITSGVRVVVTID